MKKQMLLMTLALMTVTSAFAADLGNATSLQKYLAQEAAKDLAGKQSCFNGAYKAFDQEMQESYGGRYSKQTPSVGTLQVSSDSSRQWDKYCNQSLDKKMKPTTDESKIAYQVCDAWNNVNSVAALTVEASTSGSINTESLLVEVQQEVSIQNLIDVNADPETGNFVKEVSRKTTVTCKVIQRPSFE